MDCGAGDDLDAAPPESVFERDRDVDIGSRHDPGRVLDERYVAAEVRQDRRELAARVGRPDDADPVGQGVQAAQVLVGQAELGPRDRQSPGPAADGDDHPIRSPRAAVGRGDRVGVDEPGVAGLFDEVDPGGADVVGDALAFMEVAGHPLGVGQGSGEVDLGPWPAQTERFPRAPVPHQARGPSQRAHRCRAAVEGGAADPPPLDERDLCAQFGGVQGGGHTSGAASNDDNAHLACSSWDCAKASVTVAQSKAHVVLLRANGAPIRITGRIVPISRLSCWDG